MYATSYFCVIMFVCGFILIFMCSHIKDFMRLRWVHWLLT
nr:MAG TPA: hypothetical protein [Caudoviricetes sp.]